MCFTRLIDTHLKLKTEKNAYFEGKNLSQNKYNINSCLHKNNFHNIFSLIDEKPVEKTRGRTKHLQLSPLHFNFMSSLPSSGNNLTTSPTTLLPMPCESDEMMLIASISCRISSALIVSPLIRDCLSKSNFFLQDFGSNRLTSDIYYSLKF